MSDAPPDKELKAGHAPAVKAGGKRITQHKHEKPAEMTKEEVEEFGPPDQPKPDLHKQELVIGGAQVKGDKEFPAAAIKAYHEKPQPSHKKTPAPQHHVIHQPMQRK
ncbi:death-associated protein 1 homolog isoform X1 [Lineus longissimus]|uniref:death-associated protein 1 homolog isoform X1 n=1 Tax=Lineus longissimus TaxID=88925 RepID=UPI002B4D0E63